jgi:hypothetical protein
MSSQSSAKPALEVERQEPSASAAQAGGKGQLLAWARAWAETFLAELLNFLEHRRYDLRR